MTTNFTAKTIPFECIGIELESRSAFRVMSRAITRPFIVPLNSPVVTRPVKNVFRIEAL
jgi:hypothetical protein